MPIDPFATPLSAAKKAEYDRQRAAIDAARARESDTNTAVTSKIAADRQEDARQADAAATEYYETAVQQGK